MTKIKLYSIGNEGNFSYYIFDKKQEVLDVLNKIFLIDFNLKLGLTHWSYSDERKKINIEKYIDIHETICSNGGIRIDVFYGDKKMFITINCSEEDKLRFNEELFKIVEMPKPKKFKGDIK